MYIIFLLLQLNSLNTSIALDWAFPRRLLPLKSVFH